MKDVTEHLTFGPLLASWRLSLEAENKSPRTVGNYLEGLDMFLRWVDENHDETEVEDVTTEQCRAFIAYTVSTRSASTGRTRWAALRQFFAWAHEEDEIASNPMATVKQPAIDEPDVEVLDEDQVRAVLATCAGASLIERRDLAILSLMFDSGIRVTAVCTAQMSKLDLRARTVEVVEKGGKVVVKPFGVKTARAIDRYLRVRAKQPGAAGSTTIFLSTRDGRPLTRNTVLQMVRRRGDQAGIKGLHPHVFRHTFTDRWLDSGGSEGDLMELNGWSSRDMIGRYAKKTRAQRARAAHQRLSPMDNLDGSGPGT